MVKYTKFELMERILTGLVFDGSYWLIDNVLCKWDDEDKLDLQVYWTLTEILLKLFWFHYEDNRA